MLAHTFIEIDPKEILEIRIPAGLAYRLVECVDYVAERAGGQQRIEDKEELRRIIREAYGEEK